LPQITASTGLRLWTRITVYDFDAALSGHFTDAGIGLLSDARIAADRLSKAGEFIDFTVDLHTHRLPRQAEPIGLVAEGVALELTGVTADGHGLAQVAGAAPSAHSSEFFVDQHRVAGHANPHALLGHQGASLRITDQRSLTLQSAGTRIGRLVGGDATAVLVVADFEWPPLAMRLAAGAFPLAGFDITDGIG